jgi:hypothetical protein
VILIPLPSGLKLTQDPSFDVLVARERSGKVVVLHFAENRSGNRFDVYPKRLADSIDEGKNVVL